jgi:hypothetical protein
MPLEWGTNNRLLREELSRITENYADSDQHLAEQVGLITRLAAKYLCSVSLVRETKASELPFTCYQHAFSLMGAEYMRFSWGRVFVQYLVETRLDEISIEEAAEQDYVLYSNAQIEHAGKVVQDAIESKWGKAHLWRHGLFEVPWHYGNTVKFFRHISEEETVQAFQEYAKGHGA